MPDSVQIRIPAFLVRLQTRFDPVVAAALTFVVAFNAYGDRATLRAVAYPNDSSVHYSMVRFAAASLRHFHLPMTQWYPYLDLGSPHFLHYQALAATLTGALGLVLGTGTAFRLTLFLMIVAWPLVIYQSSKVFGLSRRAAMLCAAVAPFLASVSFVGYEPGAYLWIGYGVWAQLAGSMTLPFAWAFSWRSLDNPRFIPWAAFFIALTTALHFETGYSAFGGLVLMALVHRSPWRDRVRNGLLGLVGAGLLTLWVTVPLLLNARWAAINSALAPTGLVRGYGFRQNWHWLVHGQLFDYGRYPVLTVLLLVGLIAAAVLWRRDPLRRAFALLFVAYFALSWGPTTWGSLIALLPGHADIYFRRFLLSVHLAGIFLVGTGLAWLAVQIPRLVKGAWRYAIPGGAATVAACLVVPTLALATPHVWWYEARNNFNVHYQMAGEEVNGHDLSVVLDYLHAHTDGRVYAGSPLDWGNAFKVGEVPMYMYLTANDIDQVGFLLRTAALMEQPEYRFQSGILGDYQLMGVRYVLLPTNPVPGSNTPSQPAVPAVRIPLPESTYSLWQVTAAHYMGVANLSGQLDANKGTLLAQSPAILNTDYLARNIVIPVNWNASVPNFTAPANGVLPSPGRVTAQSPDLTHGTATATVDLTREGTVYLAASFDPGWHVTIDGVEATTVMIAPALVGVTVPAGHHVVVFTYHGFPWYLPLFVISFGGFGGGVWWMRRSRILR